jgi:hypothetical protein
VFGNALGQHQRLFRRERAICIDEQTGIPYHVDARWPRTGRCRFSF